MGCLSEETVLGFLERRLSDGQAAEINQHLSECESCLGLVADAARSDDPPTTRPIGAPAPDHLEENGTSSERLKPRDRVDRYVISSVVGVGGMGILYAAQDPRLDRKIALKVLRDDRRGADTQSQARLLREGQAMAQLSHPNVVSVYDAGSLGGQVYIAMEFVEGCTLADWLRAKVRPWPEVLATFVAAGRGLSAAHSVGIFHRDFKPANVLVGSNGQVKVTDFGLAHSGGPGPELTGPESLSHVAGLNNAAVWDLVMSVTATGLFKGTPAYMSPEQFGGLKTDERSDEFSFSVALYEGLYGERPFCPQPNSGLRGLMEHVTRGEVTPPPDASAVPKSLRDVVLRGLNRDPGKRYSSMDDLLTALTNEAEKAGAVPSPRRRFLSRVGLAAAAVATLGTAAAWSFGPGRRSPAVEPIAEPSALPASPTLQPAAVVEPSSVPQPPGPAVGPAMRPAVSDSLLTTAKPIAKPKTSNKAQRRTKTRPLKSHRVAAGPSYDDGLLEPALGPVH
jgi:eukaryotic-like serine/threonine-protein kinase